MRRNESTQGRNKDEVSMKHTKNNDIYEFKREKISSEIIRGIIVAETKQFLMLNKLVDGFFHDGYIIVRKCDISSYRIFDKVHFVEKKIQREIGLRVCSPAIDISLTSMRDIIFSLMENEKLFSIEKELSYRNILWLIKVKKISSHSFLADELNSEGVWEKNFRHYFSSITKIEFDSRYISLYEKLFVKNID